MKPDVILLVYGEGGHQAQMAKLLDKMKKNVLHTDIKFIGLCENKREICEIENFSLPTFRDKYSYFLTITRIPIAFWRNYQTLRIISKKYNVCGLISTGPGISILPSVYFKIKSVNIVFIETWSRFETQSLTGKFMYHLADRFYVQNKEQLKFYPKALYGGLL